MHWLSYDRLMALGSLVIVCALAWLSYIWAMGGSVVPAFIAAGVGAVIFAVGFIKREGRQSKKQIADSAGSENGQRIGYDISGNAASHTRNARIRNQDVAFKLRGNARLRDENSDIQ